MTMRKIGVMQEFPSAAGRHAQRARAGADARIAAAELAVTELDVARATALAWIRRASAAEATRTLRTLEENFTLGTEVSRGALRAGRATAVEALDAEAALARFHNRLLQLESEERQAEVELERWIGVDAQRPSAPLPDFDTLPVRAAQLRESVHLHTTLAPFDLRIEAAREDVALARAARHPDWSVELSYAKRGPDYSDMAALEFRVDLPLFRGSRQNPVIAARSATLRAAEYQRAAELRMHDTELHHMLLEWERSGAQLEQFERELVPLARERSRVALSAYRAGQAPLRSALDAFADESEIQIERAALRNERGAAWSYLRYLEAQHLHAPEAP
jgi:outer membrane protein TolC